MTGFGYFSKPRDAIFGIIDGRMRLEEMILIRTHLNVEEFAGREAEELALAAEMGVTQMNIVGFDKSTIERALELADEYEQLYATIGWHPTEAGTYTDEVEAYLLEKLKHPKVVALGEIGLDYHWMTAPKEVQEQVFRRQIQLSKDLDLPLWSTLVMRWKI